LGVTVGLILFGGAQLAGKMLTDLDGMMLDHLRRMLRRRVDQRSSRGGDETLNLQARQRRPVDSNEMLFRVLGAIRADE
jgi:hypothetical protein